MAKTLGYMITFTTYGTWLQGDERRFVKDGTTYAANQALTDSNKQNLSKNPVRLSKNHREIASKAIFEKANQQNQKVLALAVCSNHVHIVVDYVPIPMGKIVSYYKNAAQAALREIGLTGRVWTKGFDKRYCFDEQALKSRIDYVNSNHKDSIFSPSIY
ncbi:MAG: transposase [Sedimentisphaerales bacterium]|nr:transposase [Sedimentisphaerales bacterium]